MTSRTSYSAEPTVPLTVREVPKLNRKLRREIDRERKRANRRRARGRG